MGIVVTVVPFAIMANIHYPCFQLLVCKVIRPACHFPHEEVFSFGEACTQMFFVTAGAMTYSMFSDTAMCVLLQNFPAKCKAAARATQRPDQNFRDVDDGHPESKHD